MSSILKMPDELEAPATISTGLRDRSRRAIVAMATRVERGMGSGTFN
jgi:hypothetical protein